MSRRLVELTQNHAAEMTARLIDRIRTHRTNIGLRKYDDLELGRRARDLYSHLGFWLRSSSEAEVERTFRAFGAAERLEGIPVSDFVGVLVLTRRNLFEGEPWASAFATLIAAGLGLWGEIIAVALFGLSLWAARFGAARQDPPPGNG